MIQHVWLVNRRGVPHRKHAAFTAVHCKVLIYVDGTLVLLQTHE